jgi:predicted DNA-binding transcriptional regulator YafY
MDSDYSKLTLWLTPLETAALIAALRKSDQPYLGDYVAQQQADQAAHLAAQRAARLARKAVATA